MAYLGNVPARSFISFERQVFTIVNSQTAYTLSHSVTNENDIRLVVNNVVQEPGSGKAYTASGTTLTLSAALTNGTDEMYCVFLGRATATNAPGAGSVGTSQLAADAVTNAKIADDAISDEQLDPTAITGQTAETSIATDDLILLSDTSASGALKKMTRANFVSGIGGVNTPAFSAERSGAQSISDSTRTTIVFNNEFYDSSSAYDTSTGKFTPQTAGKYLVVSNVIMQSTAASNFAVGFTELYKNSSVITESLFDSRNGNDSRCHTASPSAVVDMNGSSDFILLQSYISVNSGTPEVSDMSTFSAFKIIE